MSDFVKELIKNNLPTQILEMREDARAKDIPTVRDATLNVLCTLIATKKPAKILEIGTAYGCSGVSMLLMSENSTLTTIEKDNICVEEARKNFKKAKVENRVNLFEGDASEILPMLSGKFDFVFLDGPKGHYAEYLPYIMELLEVGGILFADDVLFWGYIEKDKVVRKHSTIYHSLREFLDKISNDERLLTTVIEQDDGFSISYRIK